MSTIRPDLLIANIPQLIIDSMGACAFKVEMYGEHGDPKSKERDAYGQGLDCIHDAPAHVTSPALADQYPDVCLLKARLTVGF